MRSVTKIRSRQQFSAQIPALTAGAMQLQKQLDETNHYLAESRSRLPEAANFSELGGRITRQAELAAPNGAFRAAATQGIGRAENVAGRV